MTKSLDAPAGDFLRRWREARGLSLSARHLSFLETGRSHPSRGMVLRLAEALALPLRERNAWLLAAGYGALYRETDLRSPELAPVRRALERILRAQDPYPAFVLDGAWNIVMANATHERLLADLLPADADPGSPINVMRLVLDPNLLKSCVEDWDRVAHVLIRRVKSKLLVPDADPRVRELFEELQRLPGVGAALEELQVPEENELLLPLTFHKGEWRMSWFSTIAVIATPRDITLEELQIETLFPADEATERVLDAMT
jgi:transcriptional regulator with XRE-family HTH domain